MMAEFKSSSLRPVPGLIPLGKPTDTKVRNDSKQGGTGN